MGVWPIVHIQSFMAVTGPKTDLWLVKTVGVLITAIGLGLIHSAKQNAVTRSVAIIGATSAGFLAVIDVIYVLNNTISQVYLADAAIEVMIVIAWIMLFKNVKRGIFH